MDKAKLEYALQEALTAQNAFLVELEMLPGNNINVYVDAEGGIKVNQLKLINRAVEAAFDREVEDFALTVSSPGLDRPLRIHRQYINNVGRWLKVKTTQGEVLIGELTQVTETEITLSIPAKKKKDPAIERIIAFADIEESKIEIRF